MSFFKDLYHFLNPKFQNVFLEYKVNLTPRYGHGKPPHKELYQIIDKNRETYTHFLQKALEFKASIWQIQQKSKQNFPIEPTWNNGFLPGLDIVGIYTIIASIRPKLYIEIGSGNSTKVVYKAKKDNQLETQIISIDPQPRAEIDHIVDQSIRKPFEEIDLRIISRLEKNDVLFIDNSHRILPNSDSMVFFLEILPKIKKGVIVHIHDVYLPYDYPQFMCDRCYSEQYALALILLTNPQKYEPILANYFIYEDKKLSKTIEPIWDHPNLVSVERHGGSFWFRVN